MQTLKSRHVWLKIVGVGLLLVLIYPAYLAPLVSPQEHLRNLPIAIVNEDAGAAGRDLGAHVLKGFTSQEPRAVRWSTLPDRRAAVAGIRRGNFYAAIVIPSDYSQTLLARVAPLKSPATPSRAPEPATIEILTNPAAGPAQASAAQAAAEEAVAGVSDATSGQLTAALAAQETARPTSRSSPPSLRSWAPAQSTSASCAFPLRAPAPVPACGPRVCSCPYRSPWYWPPSKPAPSGYSA